MIKIIYGLKGTGKTKRILDMANDSLNSATGSIVFIDDDNSYMFDLKNSIRFINAMEFGIQGPKMFNGFLCGIAAQDFDIECIFIDGFLRIVKHSIDSLKEMFAFLADFTEKTHINIVMSVSGDPTIAPDFIKPYII
ncbi:MAG: twitching motility protein PilT [Clostridia bacterium]